MSGASGESSVDTDTASGSSVAHEGKLETLNPTATSQLDPEAGPVQLTRSRQSSKPLERASTLSDGYSPRADNDDESPQQHASYEKERSEESDEDFTVNWDGPDDPENPRNMSLARRWLIVIVVSLGAGCVTCVSSVYTTTYDQLTEEFNCSEIVATLGLSLYVIGLGVGPLFLAPLSEFFGRRIIYIFAFLFFLIWLVPCAVAQNIQTMLIARFFSGVPASAFLSVAGGTVGDIFHRHELGLPMMVYTASPFLGPELGPLIGGFICDKAPWRWVFYVMLMWSGAMLLSMIFLVPETYHPVLLKRKAIRLRKETGEERWQAPIEILDRSLPRTVLRSIYRPMMLLVFEPMCLNLCTFSAILLGILYLFFGAFNLVFSDVYGFSLSQVGMSFLGMLVGMLIATGSDPIWRRNYARIVHKHELRAGESMEYEPEWRLPPAIGGGPLVTAGLFIFAWTIFPHVHWIVPIIGSSLFGAGTVLLFSGIFTFLVDAYPLYAASALAANSFMRSSFAAAFPLFGIQMYNNLGYHWATSLIAFLTLVMAPFPYIFYVYGKRIRGRSRFAANAG